MDKIAMYKEEIYKEAGVGKEYRAIKKEIKKEQDKSFGRKEKVKGIAATLGTGYAGTTAAQALAKAYSKKKGLINPVVGNTVNSKDLAKAMGVGAVAGLGAQAAQLAVMNKMYTKPRNEAHEKAFNKVVDQRITSPEAKAIATKKPGRLKDALYGKMSAKNNQLYKALKTQAKQNKDK